MATKNNFHIWLILKNLVVFLLNLFAFLVLYVANLLSQYPLGRVKSESHNIETFYIIKKKNDVFNDE